MTAPTVSVVIPTHNRVQLLEGAVGSVYLQEGRGDLFHVEVIVVDDASTDPADHLLDRFPSIRLIRLDENRGPAGARNEGIKRSSGKYVAFLDDDDQWLPHRLRSHVPILEANPDVGVVYGQGVVSSSSSSAATIWPDSGPSGRVFEEFVTRTSDFINIDTVLVRRELFQKAGLFDESLPTMEHYDMALRLAFHAVWQFAPGPVSYGRLLEEGKWNTELASGNLATALSRISERALALLGNRPADDLLRQRTRLAVLTSIANLSWINGGVEGLRAHLLATLRVYPWMARSPEMKRQVRRVARVLARDDPRPDSTVRVLWEEVTEFTGLGLRERWRNRRLQGDLLRAAADGLRERGDPYQAAYFGASALLCDPTQIGRKRFVVSMGQICVAGLRSLRARPPARGSAN